MWVNFHKLIALFQIMSVLFYKTYKGWLKSASAVQGTLIECV